MSDDLDGEINRSWWPSGASERLVRECNCGYCTDLIEQLEHERAAADGDTPATDDGDLSLEVFAE